MALKNILRNVAENRPIINKSTATIYKLLNNNKTEEQPLMPTMSTKLALEKFRVLAGEPTNLSITADQAKVIQELLEKNTRIFYNLPYEFARSAAIGAPVSFFHKSKAFTTNQPAIEQTDNNQPKPTNRF